MPSPFIDTLNALGISEKRPLHSHIGKDEKDFMKKLREWEHERAKTFEAEVAKLCINVFYLFKFLNPNSRKAKTKTAYLVPGINLPEQLAKFESDIIKSFSTEKVKFFTKGESAPFTVPKKDYKRHMELRVVT
jgi:hypothetical protein